MLIVAIHDVAPSTLGEVRWLLDRLDDLGVTPRVLKVVPGEGETRHRTDEPDEGGELSALVRAEAAAGSEIVLHGWSHRAAGPVRGGPANRLRARLFAGDGAEFLSLDRPQMDGRLAAGRAWLEERGVTPRGFCAPGWLGAPGLEAALRAAGFEYHVTLRGLRDLRRGGWVTLPPIGYMGRGDRHEALIRLGSAVLARPLASLLRAPARRIFLHPQGASRSPHCARVLRQVEVLARGRRPTTYSALL